jgi:hypothetical protein
MYSHIKTRNSKLSQNFSISSAYTLYQISPVDFQILMGRINSFHACNKKLATAIRKPTDSSAFKSLKISGCIRAFISQWPREGVGLRPLACWDCRFKSHPGHRCLSLVSVVCCQVEVSAIVKPR